MQQTHYLEIVAEGCLVADRPSRWNLLCSRPIIWSLSQRVTEGRTCRRQSQQFVLVINILADGVFREKSRHSGWSMSRNNGDGRTLVKTQPHWVKYATKGSNGWTLSHKTPGGKGLSQTVQSDGSCHATVVVGMDCHERSQ